MTQSPLRIAVLVACLWLLVISNARAWVEGPVPGEAVEAAVSCAKRIVGESLFESSVLLDGGGPIGDAYRVSFLLLPPGTDKKVQFDVVINSDMTCHREMTMSGIANVPKCEQNPEWCEVAIESAEAESIALATGLEGYAGKLSTELRIGGGRQAQLVWKVTLVLAEKDGRTTARIVEVGAYSGEVVGQYVSMMVE